jgi:outer membrane protein W
MKTLIKISAICALVLCSFTANAQIKVGAGLGIALPMGDFGDMAKMGFGGGVSGKYMLNDNMALGLGVGFYSFSPKNSISGYDVKYSIMPIAASFTYYFATEGFKPYAGADLGFYSFKTKVTYSGASASTSVSKLGFAPTVGFEYGLSDALALDVNAKYNYITTEGSALTYVGVNVGLVYSLGK